jgi:hypothetical protein
VLIETDLVQFLRIGGFIIKHLKADGYWSDLIDPCSGFPVSDMRTDRTTTNNDFAAVKQQTRTTNIPGSRRQSNGARLFSNAGKRNL